MRAPPDVTTDAPTARAVHLWQRCGGDVVTALRASPHGEALERAGFAADVQFAAREDAFDVAPEGDDRRIGRVIPSPQ